MVDEDTKKRAAVKFIEKLDKLCEESNKDSQKMVNFKGSWEETFEKAKKYYLGYARKMNALENDLFIPYKLGDRIDICSCWKKLNSHGRDLFAKITNILGTIKCKPCSKCNKNLSMNNCYVYFNEAKSVQKWTLMETKQFNSEEFRILFCSENCYKQSTYYQNTQQQKRKAEREREREREREQFFQQSTTI